LCTIIFVSFFIGYQNIFVLGEPFQTINISDKPGESDKPQIFAFNKTLHMIWTDKFEGNHEIYYSQIDSELEKLSSTINLSNNNGSSAFPRLHVENDIVYATWYDYSPGQSDVFFAKSIDGGKKFTIKNLSNDQKASYNPWIDGIKNNVYVVWNDGGKSEEIDVSGVKRIVDILFGDMEIYFAHSDDYGKTFEVKNISNTKGDSVNPRLRIEENKVFVVWSQDTNSSSQVYFSKSENYGHNFTSPINISNSLKNSYDSGITLLENNVYVIWKESDKNQTDVFFSKSSDYGSTFDSPMNLSMDKGDSLISRDTQIRAVGDNIFVVFSAEINKNREVYVTISRDKGKTFEEPINISNNSGNSQLPQVYSDGNNLFVLWEDDSNGNFDILLRQSIDKGHSFGPIKNITPDLSNSLISVLGPQISSSDDQIFVFWENKSKTDDLFLTMVPKQGNTGYNFEVNNQKIDAKLKINENDLVVPVDIIFQNDGDAKIESDVVFKMTTSDQSGNEVLTTTELADNGNFSGNLNLPKKGEYYLHIEPTHMNKSNFTKGEIPDIIINVIPEFPSGLAIFTLISIIFIIIGKNYAKVKYLN
jgi:hypothetical protein